MEEYLVVEYSDKYKQGVIDFLVHIVRDEYGYDDWADYFIICHMENTY